MEPATSGYLKRLELARPNVHVGRVLRESAGQREWNPDATKTDDPGGGRQMGHLKGATGRAAGHHGHCPG